MNLNQSTRQAIVSAVMDDIPRVHTKNLDERLQKIVDEDIAKNAPKPLAAMWKDKELRKWVNQDRSSAGYLMREGKRQYVPTYISRPTNRGGDSYMLSDLGREMVEKTLLPAMEEGNRRADMQSKLTAALAGMRTVKQFKTAYPELAKYAPKEDPKTGFPVALANVVADLTALGWPAKTTKAA